MEEELDLRGEVCPYTFVKTKLALEQLADGQILRVIVDHKPAAENVPRSAHVDGHRVLSVYPLGPSLWHILIEKCPSGRGCEGEGRGTGRPVGAEGQ